MTPDRTRGLRPRRLFASGALAAIALAAPPAGAYDPATTHAGLTEQAALASQLHRVLARGLGRPLGLLEPLQMHSRLLPADARRAFWTRLEALDPAGGYRPSAEGINQALGWVVAGAVLAETPPERGRNHFFDPSRGRGLEDAPGLSGTVHALRLAIDDASTVRDLATGTAFTLTGKPSVEWVKSPQNDLGLVAFHAHLERAVGEREAAGREFALVRALLALGGMLAVLEDAGEPAHVRNDFRGAYLEKQGTSGWNRGSAYERFVATRYGRVGVPAPKGPVRRPTLEAFFTAPDRTGLADLTHRRFFSEGTVPGDAPLDTKTTAEEVVRAARESLPYPEPSVPALDLRAAGARRYLVVDGRRTLAYERTPARVRFLLDENVYADTARAILPEIGAYAAGFIDHLFRVNVGVTLSGSEASIAVSGATGEMSGTTLRLFAEDSRGIREELPAASVVAGASVTVAVPAGTRRVGAVLRGRDSAGPFVGAGESPLAAAAP